MRSLPGLVVLAASLIACAADAAPADEGGRFDEVNDSPERSDPSKAPATTSSPGGSAPTSPLPDAPSPAPPPTPPSAPSADAETSCIAPRDLGAITGDTGTPSTTAQGKCSEWLRILVKETNTGLLAGPMKLTVTLLSPERENFDVYLYVDTATDAVACGAASAKSERASGLSDIARLTWGEQYTPNNSNDSRSVSIEVRNRGTGCASTPWNLLIQGNY